MGRLKELVDRPAVQRDLFLNQVLSSIFLRGPPIVQYFFNFEVSENLECRRC
jgi:hypothetical protein